MDVTNIDGEVISVAEEGEAWEFNTTITEKRVLGWLKDAVLARVGKTSGDVTSKEDNSSFGTCEICGSDSYSIEILVDGETVYFEGVSTGLYDEEGGPNPFIALNEWLNSKENN